MREFLRENRRLLGAYCLIARILGWYLILVGPFWLIVLLSGGLLAGCPQEADVILYAVSGLIFDFFVPGLLAFAVSGLLDYLLRPDTRPRLILRITDKLCYVYAVFLILKAFAVNFWFVNVKFLEISGGIGIGPHISGIGAHSVSAAIAEADRGKSPAPYWCRRDTASFATRHRRIQNAGLKGGLL